MIMHQGGLVRGGHAASDFARVRKNAVECVVVGMLCRCKVQSDRTPNRHHETIARNLDINDYLFDVADVDWAAILAPWHFVLPANLTVWLVNRFGDIFAVVDDNSVHMLDIGTGTFERVANSRDEFCDQLEIDDNANQWLMIPLINKLVAAEKRLRPGHCYGYLRSPILGGDYTTNNTVVIPIAEHYALSASLHTQIKDFPDGTPVKIVVADD